MRPEDDRTRRATLTQEYQRDWPSYFDAVQGQPPRDTLVRALDAFEREGLREGTMIDLACGEGRDGREALRRTATRWHVIAIDSSAEGLRRAARSMEQDRGRVEILELAMEAVPAAWRPRARAVHLINASFALPFCEPGAFPALWAWVLRTLAPGGRFAGQFFGDRDEWASVRPKSHFTRPQLGAVLSPLHLEHLDEVEKDGSDAMGGVKHHHVFHVVARTPA